MGVFKIRVGHKTQRFCFCYFPNIKLKWNKLNEKYWIIQIMIIYMVVIFHMHIYLCINILIKKNENFEYISFYI
jgi:hypothetical protein